MARPRKILPYSRVIEIKKGVKNNHDFLKDLLEELKKSHGKAKKETRKVSYIVDGLADLLESEFV